MGNEVDLQTTAFYFYLFSHQRLWNRGSARVFMNLFSLHFETLRVSSLPETVFSTRMKPLPHVTLVNVGCMQIVFLCFFTVV